MSFNEEQIKEYLLRLHHIQERQINKALTWQERRDLALSLGFSEKEFDQLEQDFQAHQTKSQGFLALGNWPEALKELDLALALQPYDKTLRYNKAICHAAIWRKGREAMHLEQAELSLRKCLDLDPKHEQAMHLLTELQKEQTQSSKPLSKHNTSQIWFVRLLVGFILLFFISIVCNGLNQVPTAKVEPSELTPNQVEQVLTDPRLGKTVLELAEGLVLPVVLDETSKHYALWLRVESFNLSDMQGLALLGGLELYVKPLDFNMAELSLDLELLDSKDRVLHQAGLITQLKAQDYALDGDAPYPISISILLNGAALEPIAKARLKVDKLTASDLPKAKLQPTAWSWEKTPPPAPNENPELYTQGTKGLVIRTLHSRFDTLSHLGSGQNLQHRLVLEILNLHEQSAIASLTGNIEWRDEQGKRLSSKKIELISKGQPNLAPKQAARYHHYLDANIPTTVHSFHLNLNEIKLKN